MTTYFLLGSPDVEARAIEERARALGHPVFWARSANDPNRVVNAAEAANGQWLLPETMPRPKRGDCVFLIELQPNDAMRVLLEKTGAELFWIDHHRPADPPIPSILQVCTILGVTPTPEEVWIGLCDQDLAQAYALARAMPYGVEHCLTRWRAQWLGVSTEDIRAAQDYVRDALRPTPIPDLYTSDQPSPNNLTADFAMAHGWALLVPVKTDASGVRYVLIGDTRQVRDQIAPLFEHAAQHGWKRYYHPKRGIGNLTVPHGYALETVLQEIF